MKPWTALAIIGAFTAIAFIAVSFIESGTMVEIINPLEIRVGKEAKPAPIIHYHITQEKRGFGT